ncbi:MAG: peptidyl-prolyl cis-trans isomerase [Kiritimatiellia bacterium]|nr:peptidyl-prolyl cis-trans isomerase [Kiritimatiellia bacterium]
MRLFCSIHLFVMLVSIAGRAVGSEPEIFSAEAIPLDSFVARVNDRVITMGDVILLASAQEQRLRMQASGINTAARIKDLYSQALNELIDRALILEEVKRKDLPLNEKAIDDYVAQNIREQFGNDRTKFLEALASERISLDEYRARNREDLLVLMLRRQEIGDRAVVTPREVRNLYEDRLEQYTQPEQIKLSVLALHRGVTPEDQAAKRELADKLSVRLRNGEDFAGLARENSEGPGAAAGGEWNWMGVRDVLPEIRMAVSGLEPGGLSPVLETPEWLFILRLDARRPGKVTPFEDVRQEIESALRRTEEQRVYRAWISSLQARHFVERISEPWMEIP